MNDKYIRYNLLFASVILLRTVIMGRCSPLEIVYSGDSCDCPKHYGYTVNIPPSPSGYYYTHNIYDYKIDNPQRRYPKPSYIYGFTIEEPYTAKPLIEKKFNGYAKIDRITAKHQDCIVELNSKERTCLQTQHSHRYPKEVTTISQRNETTNAANEALTAKYVQVRPSDDVPYIRRKREVLTKGRFSLTKVKTTPRTLLPSFKGKFLEKKAKLMKMFSKARTTARPRSTVRSKQNARQKLQSLGPLENLRNFLHLPSKRDIKGEYDLIEKERDQQDLHLPEIIQYMPETLNPNFKRAHCTNAKQEHNKRNLNPANANTMSVGTLKALPTAVAFDSLPRPFATTRRQQSITYQSPARNCFKENAFSTYSTRCNIKRKPNRISNTQLERAYMLL
ncbi:uncharacterized protein LOC119637228 [Glossina fuscipes]|uniref:Uncharacterized protein LOC119637228 n=1 Tax=Glossina fuscipes TaxID=7396 RepID=A0A9C5YZK4_9MUSC|nr:uncharacterized protein LOC119637228 [Glossina fuscipes]KAI9582219.1 hypothetical protein GQX74_015342 [Glossina fuscipes]